MKYMNFQKTKKCDFSTSMLHQILVSFKNNGYTFVKFEDYWKKREEYDLKNKHILLRHDVDSREQQALDIALLERKLGILGTYFFRVPKTLNYKVIEKIGNMGHEIGYHYECLAQENGDYEKAYNKFKHNLSLLRQLYPVVSIAMHSLPMNRWDSRLFWNRYELSEFELLGETYKSINHNKFIYVSDSGRDWNYNSKNVVWDKVQGKAYPPITKGSIGLLDLIDKRYFNNIQLLIHPPRWSKTRNQWIYQFIKDKSTNTIKIYINILRKLLERQDNNT